MNRFNVTTLDGEKLINRCKIVEVDMTVAHSDGLEYVGVDYRVEYEVDLTKYGDRHFYVKDQSLRDDNALFYQIRKLFPDVGDTSDADFLLDKIMIVDFGNTFSDIVEDAGTSRSRKDPFRHVRTIYINSEESDEAYEIDEGTDAEASYGDTDDYTDEYGDDSEYGDDYADIYDEIVYDEDYVDESFFDFSMPYPEAEYNRRDLVAGSDRKSDKLRMLFSYDYEHPEWGGIFITFKDPEEEGKTITKHFVAFDKSQSMARDSKITFIDVELREQLEKRLWLNMDFHRIEMNLSKFYAYKGLYLSSAKRVEFAALGLNEDNFFEKIIVLPDEEEYTRDGAFVSAETFEETEIEEMQARIRKEYDLDKSLEECKKIRANSYFTKELDKTTVKEIFDGEGLISPACCEFINRQLCAMEKREYMEKDKATSFQIRMPFMKGMLHTVDFKRFVKTNMQQINGGEGSSYMIKDCFGIERDLLQAEIVMTQSMFKAAGWIRDLIKENLIQGEDPMAFYGKRCIEYDHAIYISGTNLPYNDTNLIKLNYQLLGTMSLDRKKLGDLVEQHMSYAIDPIEYLRRTTTPYSKDTDNGPTEYRAATWVNAVLNDNAFAKDKNIPGKLEDIYKSLKRGIAYGNLLVDGENRYLSRDLLYFMLSVFKMPASIREKYAGEVLSEHYFYMPGDCIDLKDGAHYTFFRNPHLSRYEQCAMRARKPEAEVNGTQSVYEEYFGALKGVVMVSKDSFAPQALGGADFDGDLVKVINNDIIRDDVLKNNYGLEGEYDPAASYERTSPIILIPSTKESRNEAAKPSRQMVKYAVILDTFSSKVGYISNLAVKIGQDTYCESPSGNARCHECTILTGLEIDACKTGVHPNLSLLQAKISQTDKLKRKDNEMNQFRDVMYEYVHSFKNRYERGRTNQFGLWIDEKKIALKKGERENVYSWGSDRKILFKYPFHEDRLDSYSTLKILPYFFFRVMDPNDEAKYRHAMKKLTDSKASSGFSFTTDKWERKYTAEFDRTMPVFLAYELFMRLLKDANSNYKKVTTKNWVGYMNTIMKKQHDFINVNEKDAYSMVDVSAVCDATLPLFADEKAVHEALERLEEKSNWPYLKMSDRYFELANVLKLEKMGNDEKEMYAFLVNYDKRGYLLLYLFLKDIERRIYAQNMDLFYVGGVVDKRNLLEDIISYEREKKGENDAVPSAMEIEFRRFRAALDCALTHGKGKAQIQSDFNSLLRSRLEDILQEECAELSEEEKRKLLLKIYWGTAEKVRKVRIPIQKENGKSSYGYAFGGGRSFAHDFFWDFFTAKEILSFVRKG